MVYIMDFVYMDFVNMKFVYDLGIYFGPCGIYNFRFSYELRLACKQHYTLIHCHSLAIQLCLTMSYVF